MGNIVCPMSEEEQNLKRICNDYKENNPNNIFKNNENEIEYIFKNILDDYKKDDLIILRKNEAKQYIIDENFRNCVNKTKDELNTKLCLHISCFTDILNMENLIYADAVEIYECDSIINMNIQSSICELKLSSCSKIKDISAFRLIHALTIRGCDHVKDISMLTSNNTLNISYSLAKTNKTKKTQRIRDVGNLREIKK